MPRHFDHVDLRVQRGEIHALVGENGAGKTTLMKALYGLEQPDSGQILLDGRPVAIPNPDAAIRHGIGILWARTAQNRVRSLDGL